MTPEQKQQIVEITEELFPYYDKTYYPAAADRIGEVMGPKWYTPNTVQVEYGTPVWFVYDGAVVPGTAGYYGQIWHNEAKCWVLSDQYDYWTYQNIPTPPPASTGEAMKGEGETV